MVFRDATKYQLDQMMSQFNMSYFLNDEQVFSQHVYIDFCNSIQIINLLHILNIIIHNVTTITGKQ